MWYTQDAVGEVSWIYFIVLIIMGNVLLVSVSIVSDQRPLRKESSRFEKEELFALLMISARRY